MTSNARLDSAASAGAVAPAEAVAHAPHAGHVKLNVFISYSRDDIAFAEQLEAALQFYGFATTIDRHGISGGEDWKRRLGALIRDADTVCFVLSPASARSDICAWEVAEAARLGKRILPVLCRALGDIKPPALLSDLNYVFFYDEPKSPGSGFGTGLVRLITALETDVEWMREHTRILQRATEWDAAGRTASRLLFGDAIEAAKSWAARRPREAPEPTSLHLEFIRASEEEAARRDSAERQQLEAMAAAQAERATALAEKEDAQKREAAQARRVVQRTLAGFAAALLLAVAAGVSAWQVHLGNIELSAQKTELEKQKASLQAANLRLGAEMKLRIAPFGKEAYAISENWYKLATTNAASIAFVEQAGYKPGQFVFCCTGFLVKGSALYEPWGDEPVMVTMGDLSDAGPPRIYFPAIDKTRYLQGGERLWGSADKWLQSDATSAVSNLSIWRVRDHLPSGVHVISELPDFDFSGWGNTKIKGQFVPESAMAEPVPLIILGATVENYDGKNLENNKPILALSASHALGRTDFAVMGESSITANDLIVYTDSTTVGSGGSPVFHATTGQLVSLVQIGTTPGDTSEKGYSYSAGISIQAMRQMVRRTLEHPLAIGYRLLKEGRDADAEAEFAKVHDDKRVRDLIDEIAAEFILKRATALSGAGKFSETIALLENALRLHPNKRGNFSGELYEQGRKALERDDLSNAEVLMQKAGAMDEWKRGWIVARYVERGKYHLLGHRPEAAGKLFASAVEYEPSAAADVAQVRAFNHYLRDDYARALSEIETAIKLKPHDDSFKGLAGQIHLALGHMQEANALLSEATKFVTYTIGEVFDRARIREASGDKPGAISDYRKVLSWRGATDTPPLERDYRSRVRAASIERLKVLGETTTPEEEKDPDAALAPAANTQNSGGATR